MNVILTCTFSHPGHELPHQTLEAAGLMPARPSRRENMTPAQLHRSILKAHRIDGTHKADSSGVRVVTPGKLWQDLAVDLFLGNLENEAWGWVEPSAIHFLDFWRSFDPQIGFVLAYSSPATVLGGLLRGRPADDEEIGRILLDWCHFNTELLRFYHANRDCCLLVNADAIDQHPQAFVERVTSKFALGQQVTWTDGKPLPERPADARLLEFLALQLVQNADTASSLYDELESTADLPAVESGQNTVDIWDDYARVLQSSTAGLVAAKEQIDTLAATVASQETSCTQLEREKSALAGRHEEQAKLAAERQTQIGQLAQARDQQAKLATERQAALDALTKEKVVLVQAKAKLEQEKSELAGRQEESTKLAGELKQIKDQHQEQQQENELLLLQLHQVQEELERYFLENQRLKNSAAPITPVPAPVAARDNPLAEVLYDLRKEIDGDNWYYPEHDGRWAGPEDHSLLRVPALAPGRYRLQLCVVDAMDPEILSGMKVAFNGVPINLNIPAENAYPQLIDAEFTVDESDLSPRWEFALQFPRLVSPADSGGEDFRRLAVRLASLRLCQQDETAPWAKKEKPSSRWAFGKKQKKG